VPHPAPTERVVPPAPLTIGNGEGKVDASPQVAATSRRNGAKRRRRKGAIDGATDINFRARLQYVRLNVKRPIDDLVKLDAAHRVDVGAATAHFIEQGRIAHGGIERGA